MRIHTDVLTNADLRAALARDNDLVAVRKGSRSRDHAYDVTLTGFGARHTRASGSVAAHGDKAATYTDWGRWIAKLFELDPNAIAGPYRGADDFHTKTESVYDAASIVPYVRDLPRELAADVRRLVADGRTKRTAYAEAGREHGLSSWTVERVTFGE